MVSYRQTALTLLHLRKFSHFGTFTQGNFPDRKESRLITKEMFLLLNIVYLNSST